MSRTVTVTSLPFGYDGLIRISTRPFGTVVGRTRSPDDGAGVGATLAEQAPRTSAATKNISRIVERLLRSRAEEHLLKIGERRAEPGDEEDADEEAPETRDEPDDDIHGAQALRADESRSAHHGDARVGKEQPYDERQQDNDAGDAGRARDPP